jgi:predicted dehydrogenase
MITSPIHTCVLGVGLSGLTFHIPFILALPEIFTLHSVLERNPQSPGGKVHDRFGVSTKIHKTLDQVLADKDVEFVIVGTPNDTHYSFVKATLEAGKHGALFPMQSLNTRPCMLTTVVDVLSPGR